MGAAAAGGAGAAAAAAIAQAVKASGAIVRVSPDDFLALLWKAENPLVVVAQGGFLRTNYQYLFGHRGLVFFTKSPEPLQLGNAEVVAAQQIWVPA